MSELKTVKAQMIIELNVDCPNCEKFINLLDESETNERDLNDDEFLLKQALPDNENWMDAHEKFACDDVVCSECKTKFNVKELTW